MSYIIGPPDDGDGDSDGNGESDPTSDGFSAGVAVGIAVALTLLVAVCVVIGCSGAWCIWRCGRGQGTQQKLKQLQGAINEVPDTEKVKTAIPLTDGQVNI